MVEIYKQAKNMEKANCALTDNELFVTLKDYKELQQQLQAYKDKEYKLREYIDGDEVRVYNDKRLSDSYKDGYARCCVDILQILNEGKE